jgi:hypothetical protein
VPIQDPLAKRGTGTFCPRTPQNVPSSTVFGEALSLLMGAMCTLGLVHTGARWSNHLRWANGSRQPGGSTHNWWLAALMRSAGF